MITHALCLLVCGPALAGPPPTPVERVVETVHGAEIVDEYRWLENLESHSEQVERWTTAQNDYTRAVLDAVPGRVELEAELGPLMSLPSISAPVMRSDLYFYRRRTGSQNQPVLEVRRGHAGAPRVLLDPNALDEKGLVSLDWFSPSPDGSLVAFGISRAGDEKSVLHLLETATGRWLPDEIPNKAGSVSWLPDGRSFIYENLQDVENPYSGRVRYHEVGTHPRQDHTLFEQYKEGPLATTWGPFGYATRDGRWLVLGYYTSTKANDLWVADLDRWRRTGELVRTDIIVGDDSRNVGPVLGDTLFLHTTSGASNGRVFAVDLNEPARERWVEVIPQREDAVLRAVALARGVLVATYEKYASTSVELFALDGRPRGALQLPSIGTAGVSTEDDRVEAFLSFTSFTDPASIWRIDLSAGRRELWERVEAPFDPNAFQIRQVWYPSRDGTSISMFLVHRKGLRPDGNHPTLLYGYGGFNISLTPAFDARRIPWLAAGGVLAIPNLRGGGEYGEAWHAAGILERKQNVFDDFIAAAEYLIGQGITSPRRLAIAGGSNGGLLVGAAVTQRPDLFAAAVCAVPLLDMVRYHRFLMARYWVPEYGDPDNPEHFKWLRAYSPYHNVRDGLRYPAILFTAGENDSRVHPLHARKMAALLQSVAANDLETHPILLWVDRSAGHGAGKPLWLRIRDAADSLSFAMWQTGLAGDAKAARPLPEPAAAGSGPGRQGTPGG
jgi:prolyl oligopeptidase